MSTGQRRIGKYELHELLGRGGMAEVWKAFDPNLQRYVAIKILHADLQNDGDFIKRFEREARVIASLRHPHIVQVHDFQLADPSEAGNTRAYMVMKYIEGPTLTEYIRRTSRAGNFPPVADLIYLFTCVGAAIDYAHQHGMIHRDIKPSNIMLDKGVRSRYQIGEPVLTDFGIVKLMGASTGTLSGWWIGTPAYISPEQAQGHPGNERSDIYSLGVILYEICTGVRPFLGDSPVSIIMQHISATPTLPELINPRISPALSEVIMRGLAKDPEARFPTASSLATALAQALGSSYPPGTGSAPYRVDASPAEKNRTPLLPSDTPSSPSSPQRAALSTPQFATPVGNEQRTSMTPPGGSIASNSSVASSSYGAQTTTPSSPPSALFEQRRRRTRVILLITLFIFVLVGSNLLTFYLSSLLNNAGATGVVGQAYFVSSGQISSDSGNGINDEVQVDLHNIPPPAPGNSYYAWLLGDRGLGPGSTLAVLLGKLSVEQGEVDFLYPGDAQHIDLIANYSQFLVTEESANSVPNQPSSDHSTWRFFGALPQAQPVASGSLYPISGLQAMRNILYQIPNLTNDGIQDSLEVQFYQSVQIVSQLTSAAASEAPLAPDPDSIHTQVINILNYLVGTSKIQTDVGSSSLSLSPTHVLVNIPLIDLVQGQNSSYTGMLLQQVGYLQSAAGITMDASTLARQIRQVLGNVETLLKALHQDAVNLARLGRSDLLQPSTMSTLDTMAMEASNAFYGYLEPGNDGIQPGVVWIHQNIQHLAVIDVSKV